MRIIPKTGGIHMGSMENHARNKKNEDGQEGCAKNKKNRMGVCVEYARIVL